LDTWIDYQKEPEAIDFVKYRDEMVNNLDAARISDALRYFYTKRLFVDKLLMRWWNEEIIPAGEWYYVLSDIVFCFNIPKILNSMARKEQFNIKQRRFHANILYRKGFSGYIDNHEMIKQFIGIPQSQENVLYTF